MDEATARRIFLLLIRARPALSEALAETIRSDQREAGERIFAAITSVEEVLDECTRIAPTLHHARRDDWPEEPEH